MVNEDEYFRPALIQKHNDLHFYLNHHFRELGVMFHEQLTSLITLSCLTYLIIHCWPTFSTFLYNSQSFKICGNITKLKFQKVTIINSKQNNLMKKQFYKFMSFNFFFTIRILVFWNESTSFSIDSSFHLKQLNEPSFLSKKHYKTV